MSGQRLTRTITNKEISRGEWFYYRDFKELVTESDEDNTPFIVKLFLAFMTLVSAWIAIVFFLGITG